MIRIARFSVASLLALGLIACGGEKSAEHDDDRSPAPSAAAPATAAVPGKVIEVKTISDDRGNRFEPAEIEARPGDILRITNVSGVHNISFPAEQNPGKSGLPEPAPMLQLPGQSHDVPLTFGEGHFSFQCDPHAALGMVGKLEVEKD